MNDIFWIFFIFFGGLMLYVLLLLIYDWIKEEKQSKQKINEYRAKIEQWKTEGYEVSELEEMMK